MTIHSADHLEGIAAALTLIHGFTASVEYPGYVAVWAEDLVDRPDLVWAFGTDNGPWSGQLLNGQSEFQGLTVTTDCPATEPDSVVVAAAIAEALHECERDERAGAVACDDCERSYGPGASCQCKGRA